MVEGVSRNFESRQSPQGPTPNGSPGKCNGERVPVYVVKIVKIPVNDKLEPRTQAFRIFEGLCMRLAIMVRLGGSPCNL